MHTKQTLICTANPIKVVPAWPASTCFVKREASLLRIGSKQSICTQTYQSSISHQKQRDQGNHMIEQPISPAKLEMSHSLRQQGMQATWLTNEKFG